ncbi:hypothetical protein Q4543_24195, partial [Salipiger sp. 1_MG-2023]|nr:hypothetical protein [Salipiger sp. 1_MG-2023]
MPATQLPPGRKEFARQTILFVTNDFLHLTQVCDHADWMPEIKTPKVVGAYGGSSRSRPLHVTSRQVIWLFLEQLWLEFVPVLHR